MLTLERVWKSQAGQLCSSSGLGFQPRYAVPVGSAVEALQPFGAENQAATTVVARRVAAERRWQRGGSGAVGTSGGTVDAGDASGRAVSKLQIATRVGWKLFGARFDGSWCVER